MSSCPYCSSPDLFVVRGGIVGRCRNCNAMFRVDRLEECIFCGRALVGQIRRICPFGCDNGRLEGNATDEK